MVVITLWVTFARETMMKLWFLRPRMGWSKRVSVCVSKHGNTA